MDWLFFPDGICLFCCLVENVWFKLHLTYFCVGLKFKGTKPHFTNAAVSVFLRFFTSPQNQGIWQSTSLRDEFARIQ